MHTTNLRKVGGSVMLAVPPVILDMLGLTIDNLVGLTIENGCLIVKPQRQNNYVLKELLEEYKSDLGSLDPTSDTEKHSWLNSDSVGKELI